MAKSVKRRSSIKRRRSSKKRTSHKRSGAGKVPRGYKGSVKVGDKLSFYCPQEKKVKAAVGGIKLTKNHRYLAWAKHPRCARKMFQFVSGTQ